MRGRLLAYANIRSFEVQNRLRNPEPITTMELYTRAHSSQGLRSAFGDQHRKLTATQGEMLVVKCDVGGTNITWTHHHPSESQRPLLQSREDPDEDALGDPSGDLVVLSASVERQGNYSCSPWWGHPWRGSGKWNKTFSCVQWSLIRIWRHWGYPGRMITPICVWQIDR